MSHEDAQRKLAAAARYRALARYTRDASVRTALRETAAELEGLASAAAGPGGSPSVRPLNENRDSHSVSGCVECESRLGAAR